MTESNEKIKQFIEDYGRKHCPIRTAMLGSAYRADFVRQSREYKDFIDAMRQALPELVRDFDREDRRRKVRPCASTLYGRLVDFYHDLKRAFIRLQGKDTIE